MERQHNDFGDKKDVILSIKISVIVIETHLDRRNVLFMICV
jgi:hypothetical protein